MIIWLARHAEAVNPEEAATDTERRLTDTGRRRTTQSAGWLQGREPLPDLILHSPLVRTRETAELFQREWQAEIPLEADHLLAPGLDAGHLLSNLSARAVGCVLCIGHQPDIGRCLCEILGGGRFVIPPGTIACVEFPQVITRGAGQLRWMLSPALFG